METQVERLVGKTWKKYEETPKDKRLCECSSALIFFQRSSHELRRHPSLYRYLSHRNKWIISLTFSVIGVAGIPGSGQ